MTGGHTYSESVKNGIIQEFLKGGHTAMSLSKMYGIKYNTIYRWMQSAGIKLDRDSYDLRERGTPYLAEVNEQLYALIQSERTPHERTGMDDVVEQLKRIESCLNRLTYAIYTISYKEDIEDIPEVLE